MMTETNGQVASAEQLDAAAKRERRYKNVPLPACKLTVRIRSLKEAELSHYQAQTLKSGGRGLRTDRLEDATRRLLVLCMVDPAGNRLYANRHADKLRDWDAADTQHLYAECAAWCGIDRDDIEELVKNSELIPADEVPSG